MTKRWYIVHAYSNFENKVAESIKEQATQKGLGQSFEEVLVPTEEVVELRRGKKIASARRFFPGYVLVKMEMTDEAYHLIKNTPKVTGFLGSDNKPTPISDAEASRILHQVQEGIERPRPSISSKSASRSVSPMVLLPHSTVSSRKLMRSARGSRWRCRFSAGPRPSSSNTARSRRSEILWKAGELSQWQLVWRPHH